MSKAVLLAVVFVAACSGQKPEEKVAPPDPIVPGSKLAAPAPAPAPTPAPVPETGSGSDASGSAATGSATDTAATDAAAQEKLHDECAKKAPAKLEMSGRKEWIADCVAEANKASAAKPAEKPAEKAPAEKAAAPAPTKAPAEKAAAPAPTPEKPATK